MIINFARIKDLQRLDHDDMRKVVAHTVRQDKRPKFWATKRDLMRIGYFGGIFLARGQLTLNMPVRNVTSKNSEAYSLNYSIILKTGALNLRCGCFYPV